jgi:hypothetical protein
MFQGDVFARPRFRPGVEIELQGNQASIKYRRQGCDFAFPAELSEESARLLEALRTGGVTPGELASMCPTLGLRLETILEELDRLGLLTESAQSEREQAISGKQLYRELRRFVDRVKLQTARSQLYEALLDGTVTRSQLVGYALEYYHIVHLCPVLLAPALGLHEPRRTRELLRHFFTSELSHDRFLATALATVGIGARELERLVPLPSTFALCAALGAYARQSPLSFKAALFLFEEPSGEFNRALEARCVAMRMPAGFYEPLLRHANLNDEGEHGRISELLLEDVPAVSSEEQLVVKKNVGCVVESLVWQERQLLRYYGRVDAVIPRCFEEV